MLSVSVSQRDEWMTFDFLAMRTTSNTERRAEKERLKEEERAKAQAIEQVCVCGFFFLLTCPSPSCNDHILSTVILVPLSVQRAQTQPFDPSDASCMVPQLVD